MGIHRAGNEIRRALVGVLVVAVAATAGVALADPGGSSPASAAKAISGSRKADHLVGTSHADFIKGRRGNDVIDARAGRDTVRGGKGSDKILARDGVQDSIDCGPGAHDVATVDRSEDGVYDCERVKVPGSSQKRGSR